MVARIVGIDPGKSGGLAWTTATGIDILKMPATTHDLATALARLIPIERVYLELVHSSPQMGVKSAFTFGQNLGHIQGILAALHIPYEEVRPTTWLKLFGLKKKKGESPSAWKNRLKQRSQSLYPDLTTITLATADAVLICEYGRKVSYATASSDD